jgi:diguanylate cyclase (GGDEF)-like protein
VHTRTAEYAPLDRSPRATIVRTGGRLAAALLPLAVFAVIRAVPSAMQGSPLPWVAPAIAATVAVAAGLALIVAVAAVVERGRVRDLADLAGLGMLAVTFSAVALEASSTLGLGLGLVSAAAAFGLGSVVGPRSLSVRRQRVVGLVVALIVVEASMAWILLADGWGIGERTAGALLFSGALLLAIAAVTSFDEPARATAIGIAASAALALALAGTSVNGRVVGAAGMALAAVVVGWRLLVDRPRRGAAQQATEPPLPAGSPLLPEPPGEPEYDELARLTRELRATLDDLTAARHLIELQRAEIERASTTDPLTGLPGRSPTLDRLRTEAAEARRYSHPVAVVLVDIDRFADLNHEHGLDVGDEILRRLALRLRVRMRRADGVGRIGADAFLAILPHTDEGGAASFAQAVLDRVLERRVVTDRGEVTVSLSIGVALMRPGMALSGDELLAAAEEALASAQAAGGNRIAFDRLHGLARLDGQDRNPDVSTGDAADGDTGS